MWRNLQRHELIVSGGEVNWLIDCPCNERLPSIDLAHVDLTGGEQRPEQHGGSGCKPVLCPFESRVIAWGRKSDTSSRSAICKAI